MSIAKVDPNSEYGGSMVPGLQPGTTVHLLVEVPGRRVIQIEDSEHGKLAMIDSTGKEFTPSKHSVSFMSQIADDGQSFRIPVASNDLPNQQAHSIAIHGSVRLTCADDATTDQFPAAIRKGAKMTIADIEFEVADVKDSYMNENDEVFELRCTTSPARIQKMEAVMKNGEIVELKPAGSSRFGFQDQITWGRSYNVTGRAADITDLQVTWYQHIEEIEVPVDIAMGLGM